MIRDHLAEMNSQATVFKDIQGEKVNFFLENIYARLFIFQHKNSILYSKQNNGRLFGMIISVDG